MRFRALSPSEQAASYLRTKVIHGEFGDFLPGERRLAEEMGIGKDTIRTALELLESEGLLVAQGAGKRRRIVLSSKTAKRRLKTCILPYSDVDRLDFNHASLLHRIREAGYEAQFSENSVMGLMRRPQGIHRLIARSNADAWVVAGGSCEMLEMFAEMSTPAFAFLGRMQGISIAGTKPDKSQAHREAVLRLIELGHRRIVRLVLQERVLPGPGKVEQEFLNTLESCGIPTGPYNLPVWDGTLAGFLQRLHSVFRHSPPTALILDSPILFINAQQHLARHGILAPDNVSLLCGDPDLYFSWMDPQPTHIQWSLEDLYKNVVRWLGNISLNKNDRSQRFAKAVFTEGGTIGPAYPSPKTLPPL